MTEAALDLPPPGEESTPSGVVRLLELARRHLDLEVVLIGRVDGDTRVVRHVAAEPAVARKLEGHADPLHSTYCGKLLAGTVGSVVDDAARDPRVARLPGTRALGVGAYLGVPLHLPDGTLYGTLCGVALRPRPDLTDRDVVPLRLLADLVGQHLADEEACREAERDARERIDAVLHQNRLVVLFQPIASVVSGKVVAYEALSRFDTDPPRGPQEWFSEAARVGLGPELQAAALAKALVHLADIPEPARLNVNLGADELCSRPVRDVLDRTPLDRVTIELTEDEIHDEAGRLLPLLDALRARGAWVAVDDLGAGFTSLDRMLSLSPDVLKLDRSLVRDIDCDPVKGALVAATATFADQVGLRVVGEGVEREEELAALRDAGVPHAQGFHLGRPAPAPWTATADERRQVRRQREREPDQAVPRPRGWLPT